MHIVFACFPTPSPASHTGEYLSMSVTLLITSNPLYDGELPIEIISAPREGSLGRSIPGKTSPVYWTFIWPEFPTVVATYCFSKTFSFLEGLTASGKETKGREKKKREEKKRLTQQSIINPLNKRDN